jgi:hypothetical protein
VTTPGRLYAARMASKKAAGKACRWSQFCETEFVYQLGLI